MKPTRSLRWFFGVCFALLCLWWACYVPYRPDRLLLPIPARASMVTMHQDLEGRWEALVTHPTVHAALQALHEGLPERLVHDRSLRSVVARLVPRELVVARVPGSAPDETGAWVFSSWVGGWSHWMRWFMTVAASDRFERHEWDGGQSSWTLRGDAAGLLEEDERLTFFFEEGMVIGCIARDRAWAGELLACYEGAAASVKDVLGARAREWIRRKDVFDRGWIQVERWGAEPILLSLWDADGESIRLSLRFPVSGIASAASTDSARAGVGIGPELAGDLASGLVRLRVQDGIRSLGLMPNGVVAPVITLMLVGGEYGGRLHGLRVPAIVGLVPIDDAHHALTWIRSVLEHLNTRHGTRLYTLPATARNEHPVYSVRSSGEDDYSALPEEEQFAWTVDGRWLIVSTNPSTLESLLQRRAWAKTDSQASNVSGPWRWIAEDPHAAVAWIDPSRAGKAVRNVLALAELHSMQGAEPGRVARLHRIRAALNALDGLGEARVWLAPSNAETDLHLEITLRAERGAER